jgi:uncharacterized protein
MLSPEPVPRPQRWRQQPMILLPVKSVLVFGPLLLVSHVARVLLHPSEAIGQFVLAPTAVLIAVALFVLYTRFVEMRPVSELQPRPALKETALGFLLGSIVLASVIGVLAMLGCYHITGVAQWWILVIPFVDSLGEGVFEELLFRGVLFRVVEDSLGSYWAVLISSLVFGAAHLFNPHATWMAGVAIMVEAGVFLSAAYMLTRRLWLPIGIHAGWNFTLGGIFGVSVSGTGATGLLHGTLTGPVWLSGGEFGAEASLVTIIISGTLGIALFFRVRSMNGLIAPYWRRAPAATLP